MFYDEEKEPMEYTSSRLLAYNAKRFVDFIQLLSDNGQIDLDNVDQNHLDKLVGKCNKHIAQFYESIL